MGCAGSGIRMSQRQIISLLVLWHGKNLPSLLYRSNEYDGLGPVKSSNSRTPGNIHRKCYARKKKLE